ncbi:DUF2780 domain-containing protein [Gallaecimonas kandeliae]|uniref:DUF2780 domain-containing protein n=1 Tax=Gallaecimonas kandeliae TaxID=3029055 RepID=UPI0026482238|nr:DUF2780 domain-containing protein [Gallaecimonas kandeliae]WKE66889.1 DUF2780 domain-containing protein [Gallaecimonas kandeliae]
MRALMVTALLLASALPVQAMSLGKLGDALKSATQTKATQPQGSLVETLMSSLGVSQDQATGGAGALFALAKDKMSNTDFAKLSQVVPGMDKLLAAAPDAAQVDSDAQNGGNSSLLGKAGALLGADSNLATLNGAFESLGMDSGMVRQFLPTVLDYVQSKGGTELMQSLKTALLGG